MQLSCDVTQKYRKKINPLTVMKYGNKSSHLNVTDCFIQIWKKSES